jgi:hypothetical protein
MTPKYTARRLKGLEVMQLCHDAHNEESGTAKMTCKNGCMFLEDIMRKKLPEAASKSCTEAKTKSVDGTLLYIQDSLEKFHLYQGHWAHVINQQNGNVGDCLQDVVPGTPCLEK